MSSQDGEEEVISSPLSSPPSSLFELEDFNATPPAAPPASGPALTANLPPFHLGEPAPASRPTTRSQVSRHTEKKPSNQEPPVFDTITAANPPSPYGTPAAENLPATPTSTEPAIEGGKSNSNNDKKRKAPASSSSTAKKRTIIKRARRNDPKKWQVPFVYTDAASPLATAPLRAILLHPQAWTIVPPQDQAELRAMLAPPAGTSTSSPPPQAQEESADQDHHLDLDYLRSDDSFRFDCARYSENIENGCHDPDWLAESWTAHERRKRGDFRAYLAAKLERDWGVEVVRQSEGEAEEKAGKSRRRGSGSKDAPSTESPVASSVGENRFTELKLELVPGTETGRDEKEDGGGGEGGEIVCAG